ncbi:transcription repressor NadR [Pseudalkalibacillus caeni]|uniref:Transcription repressor NadR n=1 Tax=Exobacillus caeni TaxID=2574798 RepID=A0A5R9FAN1_9BACL|nr:transcription repressor NadR [Pseudalkalibacillus caeni]TLS39256.1 transcription repressor NadR [Pseudalkalibacillus caeni]
MISDKKILGEERRSLILKWLQESDVPLTGTSLAKRTNVSRQVIVQDISLLKARNEPIIATAQGYLIVNKPNQKQKHKRVIACQHDPAETKKELYTIVDNGATVKNVIVEHPIYGDLTASLMLSNRRDVDRFLENLERTSASLLSELTDGVHLHTIEADEPKQLDEVCHSLKEAGFLLRQND